MVIYPKEKKRKEKKKKSDPLYNEKEFAFLLMFVMGLKHFSEMVFLIFEHLGV